MKKFIMLFALFGFILAVRVNAATTVFTGIKVGTGGIVSTSGTNTIDNLVSIGVTSTKYLFTSNTFTAAKGALFSGSIGTAVGASRSDAQIEFQGGATGHALISSVLSSTASNTVNENAWSTQAYGGSGTLVQQAGFYSRWNDTNETNGYSVVGMHPNYFSGGIQSDVAFEVYGAHGIGMFLGPQAVTPTGRYLMIKRTAGWPSIAGTSDLALDANYGGSANNVFINAYNSGNVNLAAGGGMVSIGTNTPTQKLTVAGTISATTVSTGNPKWELMVFGDYNPGAMGAYTKITTTYKERDTSNICSNGTCTPNVAGTYLFTCAVKNTASTITRAITNIYKNGVSLGATADGPASVPVSWPVATQAYANGSTDYFECYEYVTGTGTWIVSGGFARFTGTMIP